MGYMQGPPPRNKYKNTDSAQNHVDRVRVPDTNYEFGGPGRGSGWRHRSLSNIDLTSQSKHSFTKQTRGYTSGLYDLYSRLETRKENTNNTENLYGNLSITNEKVESIYDRIEQTLDRLNDSESCSLRRTRSLAVIREETFNDLQIGGGIRSRRSQLIPRAKLLNRSFFQNRTNNKKKYRGEDESNSGVDTQTSETRESDDCYGKNASLLIEQALNDQKLLPALWLNDKSDLDSLDSDYFKNSLHQLDGGGNGGGFSSSGIGNGSLVGDRIEQVIIETSNNLVNVLDNGFDDDLLADDHFSPLSGINDNIPDYYTINTDDQDIGEQLENISVTHIVKETDLNIQNSTITVNSGTLTICRSNRSQHNSESEEGGGTIERKSKFKEDHRSVISYDSIYLSSEGSNEPNTLVEEEEKINEYLSDNNYSTLSEYANIKKEIAASDQQIAEDNDTSNSTANTDLYSQINKIKPKIVLLEPKAKLTTFSDITSRGTLERLTFVSSPAPKHKSYGNQTKETIYIQESKIENQYCSLPLANISQSLQASERIDAKLRLSCIPIEDQNQIYDSITNFGRAHRKLRQRECFEIVVLNPVTLDEQPKESAIVDVKPNIKELSPEPIKPTGKEDTLNRRNRLLKIDEEVASTTSTDVNDNLSSKDRQIDEIKEQPDKIKVQATASKAHQVPVPVKSQQTNGTESRDNKIEETIDIPSVKLPSETPLRGKPHQKTHHSKRQISHKSADRPAEHKDRTTHNFKNNLSNTLKRRIDKDKAKHNINEKPISKFVRNIDKTKSGKQTRVQQAIIENIKLYAQPNFNMSRPQVLHVIDSKRGSTNKVGGGHIQKQNHMALNGKSDKEMERQIVGNSVVSKEKAHKELQEKVDSVRNYWSKLIDETGDSKDHEKYTFSGGDLSPLPNNHNPDEIMLRAPTISASDNTLKRSGTLRSLAASDRDELASYTPSVEIVELDDQKRATIVKVQSMGAQDFDHVRYKIMKTDTFQKNILAQPRKEAQFDGLLQYLHDYSFQELLTQNNVVIIEPIRTKIEQISNKPHDSQILACKITAGAGKMSDGKGGLRKHFFYHPIRVNKELLDEELPTPDTVRKAKKLFEETLLFRSMKRNNDRNCMGSNENYKNADQKYLTLETYTGNNGNGANGGNGNGNSICARIKKWDSSSLSSGISSGDLSSPCDCNENDDNRTTAHDNGDELCESYYVSQDILEKIRECGSSVTYYGGRVLNNQSPEVSPMTKAIMREIRSEENICGVCQPNNCPHNNRLFRTFCDSDNNHLGVKLRLIKSNSCNSRLELTGTQYDENHPFCKFSAKNKSISHLDDSYSHEDTVKTIIRRIESNSINEKKVPRIIESKCIEKVNGSASDLTKSKQKLQSQSKESLSSLSKSTDRLGPMEILSQVSVNNHINFHNFPSNGVDKSASKSCNIMPRNKNVDLALEINNKGHATKVSKELANKTTKKAVCTASTENLTKQPADSKGIKSIPTTNGRMSKQELQDKIIKDNHKAIMQDICKKVARAGDEEENHTNDNDKPRLVKWDTLSSFDERNYFANDVSLKQKPKYDEIEFEEFEVIESNK